MLPLSLTAHTSTAFLATQLSMTTTHPRLCSLLQALITSRNPILDKFRVPCQSLEPAHILHTSHDPDWPAGNKSSAAAHTLALHTQPASHFSLCALLTFHISSCTAPLCIPSFTPRHRHHHSPRSLLRLQQLRPGPCQTGHLRAIPGL